MSRVQKMVFRPEKRFEPHTNLQKTRPCQTLDSIQTGDPGPRFEFSLPLDGLSVISELVTLSAVEFISTGTRRTEADRHLAHGRMMKPQEDFHRLVVERQEYGWKGTENSSQSSPRMSHLLIDFSGLAYKYKSVVSLTGLPIYAVTTQRRDRSRLGLTPESRTVAPDLH